MSTSLNLFNLITVGAAVFTLRVAVQWAGYRIEVELLPAADDPPWRRG
jgi:hypothetical protein